MVLLHFTRFAGLRILNGNYKIITYTLKIKEIYVFYIQYIYMTNKLKFLIYYIFKNSKWMN